MFRCKSGLKLLSLQLERGGGLAKDRKKVHTSLVSNVDNQLNLAAVKVRRIFRFYFSPRRIFATVKKATELVDMRSGKERAKESAKMVFTPVNFSLENEKLLCTSVFMSDFRHKKSFQQQQQQQSCTGPVPFGMQTEPMRTEYRSSGRTERNMVYWEWNERTPHGHGLNLAISHIHKE